MDGQCVGDVCQRLLASLPPLRGSERVVGTLGAGNGRPAGNRASVLRFDALVVRSACAIRSVRSSTVEASGAQLADLVACGVPPRLQTTGNHRRTFAAACTAHRSSE